MDSPNRYRSGLTIATWEWGKAACETAWEILAAGGAALDAAQAGVMTAEDNPEVRSVGYGGRPDADGEVTLDALLIDGPTRSMGAVGCLARIRNPIAVARRVMEKTDHILLVGDDALRFARAEGFQEQDLLTEPTTKEYREWREKQTAPDSADSHDTVTQLALDLRGDLAGACSTSGAAWKVPGRVGDSPIPGAGLYVDNEVGGAGATGLGEIAMRHCLTFLAVELMRNGRSPQQACEEAIARAARNAHSSEEKKQLALIACNVEGEWGAYAICPGFTFAVIKAGRRQYRPADSFWRNL
ncbi:MAG: N(4)-(beta-N-acetylglucosaminyl)-L-asparaginase [Candidatus Sumerlaeota bacterium]|nr:N(4)-(beta-N-acetylglucosaminyl)-L-asparaginase [Candidatus Sumerlaeota bacterium]